MPWTEVSNDDKIRFGLCYRWIILFLI